MFKDPENTAITAVAGTEEYHKLSIEKLNYFLWKPLKLLDNQSLANFLKGKSIFEPMAGFGRNVEVEITVEPKKITLVDIN